MKKLLALTFSVLLLFTLLLYPAAEGSEVSYGKGYSLITPASSAYPDDGIKLTDGIYGTVPDGKNNYYSSAAYVGFNQNEVDENGNFVIILDLGRKYTDLSAFTVGFLNETDVGIYAPKSVSFALSDERNGEYNEIGTLDTAKSTSGGLSETFAMTLAADDAEGRFVRVTVEHLGSFTDENGAEQKSGWVFIDEISAYSSGNSGTVGEASNGASSDVTPEASTAESSLTPESSDGSDISAESSLPEQVQPGDRKIAYAIWILLALSMLAMTAALFVRRKQTF